MDKHITLPQAKADDSVLDATTDCCKVAQTRTAVNAEEVEEHYREALEALYGHEHPCNYHEWSGL